MKRLVTLCALVLSLSIGTSDALAHNIKGPWAGTSIDRTYPRSDGYTGTKLPRKVIEALAEYYHLPGVTMYQITEGESGGHPGMDRYDPPGYSRGLLAINGYYSPQYNSSAEMRNPILNMRAASKIAHAVGGPNPNIWHGSSHVTGWDLHYKGNPLAVAESLKPPKSVQRLGLAVPLGF